MSTPDLDLSRRQVRQPLSGVPVRVSVKLSPVTNTARAGTGAAAKTASSTSCGREAARRAAAKFFKCGAADVQLALLQIGDGCAGVPEIYSAHQMTKGGRA